MEAIIQSYQAIRSKIRAYQYALWMLSWDSETEAPAGSVEYRSQQVRILSQGLYGIQMAEETLALTEQLYDQRALLDDVLHKEIEENKRYVDRLKKIPKEAYLNYQALLSKSGHIWAEARKNNDFEAFLPTLEAVMTYMKNYTEYVKTDELQGYDVLLDDYERHMTKATYDHFFTTLKTDLVPFVKEVLASNKRFNDAFLTRHYPKDKQKAFVEYLMEVFYFDLSKGVLKESAHPFTSSVANNDVRFTVRYHEDNFLSSIFAAIHEMGHAIYNQQHQDRLNETQLGGGASLGIHESQSRFYENTIGRSYVFWSKHFDKLKSLFPEQLFDVSLMDFYEAINKVENSLIRIEADELTYPLHIMVRYEIERAIIEDGIAMKDLPALWNKLMKDYLNITPETVDNGVMQDIHWSMGLVGYFPTYALGSAYSAQIYDQMKQEINVDQLISDNKINEINAWLKEKIHQFGATKDPQTLMMIATNRAFNPKYYVNQLKEKYTHIYHIK